MKIKLPSILLVILLIITACNGQNKNNPAEPHETETAVNTDNNYGNLEFDFYEAMQNIYLFGHKISLPGTLDAWGEDFTIDEERIFMPEDGEFFGGPLLYQGEEIGKVISFDCVNEDINFKQIASLTLGDRSYNREWRKIIQLDFLGISFNSMREEIKTILGTPTNESSRGITYVAVSSDTEYKALGMAFKDEKITEIHFDWNVEN